jgi:hypothetical protein
MGGSIATAPPTDLSVGDQPRAVAPAARLHARARAWPLFFVFPSLVKDCPRKCPGPQHADALAPGGMPSFYAGLSFSGDFLEIFDRQ